MKALEENSSVSNETGLLVDELSKFPDKTIMDEGRLAAILKISTRTLRRMVHRAELPPPISLGGRSVWLSDRILAYLNTAAELAEKEALNQENFQIFPLI